MSGIPNIEEIRKKYVANFNYKRDPKDLESKSYKYYNPDNFTTKPQRIYEMKKEIEIAKEFDQEKKKLITGGEREKPRVPILNVSFTFGHATQDWKSLDDNIIKEEAKERTLNGKNVEMAIKTLKNFDVDEIENKIEIIQIFSNETETIEKFNDLRNNGKINNNDVSLKRFLENYEILEEPYIDKITGMSALVIGNRKTKNVEIIFGASQSPSAMFQKNNPKDLTDFQGSKTLENYIEKGENSKFAMKDWVGNNVPAPIITPDNQKAALDFTQKIKEKYMMGYNGYKTLTTVNGHSKAGGEAIYSASKTDLKCFTIDPAPVINPGLYINNNKFLTIVPNMGNSILNSTEKIEGTEFYTLKYKTGIKHGNGERKVSNTLAVPVECFPQEEIAIEEKFENKIIKSIANSFMHHYPDNAMAVERLRELKKYANKIEPKFYEVYKNGKYIDDKTQKNLKDINVR